MPNEPEKNQEKCLTQAEVSQLLQERIALVFLVREDRANGFLPPYTASGRRRDLFFFEIAFDSVQALAG